jgi:hypothetical protein
MSVALFVVVSSISHLVFTRARGYDRAFLQNEIGLEVDDLVASAARLQFALSFTPTEQTTLKARPVWPDPFKISGSADRSAIAPWAEPSKHPIAVASDLTLVAVQRHGRRLSGSEPDTGATSAIFHREANSDLTAFSNKTICACGSIRPVYSGGGHNG